MEKQIIAILDHYKLNNAQLAEKLDIQRSNVSHILSGRNKPSLDLIQKILLKFPKISSDWLLFGKGEMHRMSEPKPSPLLEKTPLTKLPPSDTSSSIAFTPPRVEKQKENATPKGKTQKIIIFHDDHTFTEYLPKED